MVQHPGSPDEVAHSVLFLTSDPASYVSAAELQVAGAGSDANAVANAHGN
jgi:NAD(P)-dependent dehydrogenase (short-subunit alcohol dehydrogenase family)